MNPASLAALLRGELANALTAATPGGIEAQEAAGQRSLTSNFTRLPKDGLSRNREILERLGFKIGEDEDIFVRIEAPLGWRMEATSHSMWSDILDEHGRKRGSVFYKAAFYDRSAHFSLDARYRTLKKYEDGPAGYEDGRSRVVAEDSATGELLWSAEWIPNSNRDYNAEEVLFAQATAFLDQNYPEWRDVAAYW